MPLAVEELDSKSQTGEQDDFAFRYPTKIEDIPRSKSPESSQSSIKRQSRLRSHLHTLSSVPEYKHISPLIWAISDVT